MTDHKPFGELSDAEVGALFRAHLAGKSIEFYSGMAEDWRPVELPCWWHRTPYRIAPEPLIPDSINWEHVAPEFKWMARDEDGRAYMFREEPRLERNEWVSSPAGSLAVSFASYRRGTVDWRDSLVRRQS